MDESVLQKNPPSSKNSMTPKKGDLHHLSVEEARQPCTVISHATGNYFDLQPLIREYPKNSLDWQVRGIDYHANFTLNICAPLLLPVEFDKLDELERLK